MRALLVLEALVIIAAVTTTVLVVRHRSNGAQPDATQPGVRAGTSATASSPALAITMHDEQSTPQGLPNFKIDSEYPVVSGLPDAGLQNRVNTLLRGPVDKAVAGAAKDLGGYGSGDGEGFSVFKATAYQVGRLISVRYLNEFQFPGAGDRNLSVLTVTVRIDTAEAIPTTAMFAAGTPDDAKVAKVAAAVAQQPAVSACVGGDASAVTDLVGGLFHHPGRTAVQPNWTDAGLQFTFDGGTLGPFSCGVPAAVVPYAQLDGLLAPAVTALAGVSAGH